MALTAYIARAQVHPATVLVPANRANLGDISFGLDDVNVYLRADQAALLVQTLTAALNELDATTVVAA